MCDGSFLDPPARFGAMAVRIRPSMPKLLLALIIYSRSRIARA